jgi:serine kinase of HPr protein (carbohydrate metabolism regulator)
MDAYHGSALPIVVPVVLGSQSLHASAVVTPGGRIVAFCGASHAGKTTIAVGLSRRGCRLWADDTVAFEARPDGLTALRLPFQLNLRDKSAAYFDGLTKDVSVHANGSPPEWTRARVAAFCVLERVEESRESHAIERLSSSEAFIALLGQSFRFLPQANEEKRRMMQDYLEAVTQVPVFRLRYRPGFETLAEVIDQIEDTVLGSGAGRT